MSVRWSIGQSVGPLVHWIVEAVMIILMMAIVAVMVSALRKSRGLILLMRHVLLLSMGDDDG